MGSNFEFLKEHDQTFYQLASTAEKVFSSDPNTTLIKLRQLGEAMCQDMALRWGVYFDENTTQADLLYRLNSKLNFEPTIRELFHTLRIEGNRATHQFRTQHKEAMSGLKLARTLAIWYHSTYGKKADSFKPGPFIPPQDPSSELRSLQEQINQLKGQLEDASEQLETNQQLTDLLAREKEQFVTLAEQMEAESKGYAELAQESEQARLELKKEYETRIKTMREEGSKPDSNYAKLSEQMRAASDRVVLDEELTRVIIDQQLIAAGWETDTQELTYAKGGRPEKGKNKAIAEWPTTGKQSADYVLFAGLVPIAVVEAKRENINVAGKIPQSQRYSRGFKPLSHMQTAWQLQGLSEAWPDGEGKTFQIPFVYSSNGRPFIKQVEELSGTWFRDVREPSNSKRTLPSFHSPAGLLDLLKRSRDEAEKKLHDEGMAYLKLRDYQEKAIESVEVALEEDARECLLAMATGTGKTRTILGLMYRLLKTERFKRILFLVDRTALGDQATDVFNDAVIEQNQSLSKIYNVAELGDMAAEAETRVQVATVQAMVKRIFQSDYPPPVDEFDCIIVDEAHRGYTLDQEMTEGEMQVRDQAQYQSTYRRALEYFDAVRIGLTATPAKHTSEIFGKPVYIYSYREAVADDWLIDHEPPIRYQTLLTRNGIHFEQGEQVNAINTTTGEVELANLEDELNFNVEDFNRRVITDGFNKVICTQLAQELDPFGEEKTMIFCATDLHADMVKRMLDEAFKELYGEEYNEAAVKKITGASDRIKQLIRQYKNERYPNIAITVDLLTTGIDVPPICHLVFLRRVRSRILYEQMLGRATRRCDEIGKTVFKVYDPVDLYASLQEVSSMQPLVKDPKISMDQLILELGDPKSYEAPGSQPGTSHADDALNALNQKIMRVLRKAEKKAEKDPKVRNKLDELEQAWGVAPAKLHQHLHEMGSKQAAEFVNTHSRLVNQIGEVNALLGSERYPVISEHEDELLAREQNYGDYEKPGDYLESFNDFIRKQLNQSAALTVVVNRPRDLTRAQLKEIRLLLDQHGYSEARLSSAWRNQTNQQIAASIIGFIRQAALGEALIPFEQRVTHAMQKIYALHNWSPVQRRWLDRLGRQLVHEVIFDAQIVNEIFSQDGGAKRLDKLLGEHLDEVLETLAESVWI